MLPSVDQPYFSVNAGNPEGAVAPFGDRVPNDQNWHSGYRLEALYFLNCLDHVCARWTQFPHFSDSKTNNNPEQNAILNHPFEPADAISPSHIRQRFDFYYLEVLYGRQIYCCCPLTLTLEAGIQFARIDFNERANYFETPGGGLLFVENQSRFKGVGPEFALDFSYGVFSCLSVNGRGTASLIVNDKKAKFLESNGGELVVFAKDKKYWYV